jgi:hypothetical protein
MQFAVPLGAFRELIVVSEDTQLDRITEGMIVIARFLAVEQRWSLTIGEEAERE